MTGPLPRTPPATLVPTRIALHRLATYVVGPARHQVTGRFGLRATPGGFGTPPFGEGRLIRVEADVLVVEDGESSRAAPISTLAAAAALIGCDVDPATAAEHDSPAMGDPDEHLDIDAEAAAVLAAWFALGDQVLERLRADDASVDPSMVQLWPGHFDIAVEIGADGRRATFGASPGDHSSDEPYLYVSVWAPELVAGHPWWNATSFPGAVLPYGALVASDDVRDAAWAFFVEGRDRLLTSRG